MALEIKKGAEPKEVKEEVKAPVAVEEGNYGADRAKVAFVAPLGDPSNQDTTKVKLEDGTESKKVTATIVGYRFKLMEDLMVPDCGTNELFKKDPMNFVNVDGWKQGKKGDIIDLTPFETALLLSQPSFNGGCDGGEKPVVCVYSIKQPKAKDGSVATVSAAAATPRVSLRAQTGSIKDFDIINVLEFEKTTLENGQIRKKRTLNKGFEKWAPLAAETTRKSGGAKRGKGEAADPTKVANKNAQAFLQFVESRKVAK